MRRGTQASAAPSMTAPWSACSQVDVRIESSRLRIAAIWGNIVLNRLIPLVRASCVVLLASACAPQSDTADPAEDPLREIIHIAGGLYEARDAIHNTVFLVTSEGIILGDPIGIDFARWLKPELTDRFGSTVKYVIYSHHHPEHATGGTVFADTATFVAHENVVTALNAPFPSNAGQMDRNGNGRIERAEATDPGYPGNFDKYDRNGDGSITGVEINADTPRPDIIYSDQMSITLGDGRVELIHPGPAHTDDMTVLLFPEQRTLFGVDLLHVRRFPVSLNGYPVDQYVDAISKLQELDFDIVVAGHGNIIGEKADLLLFLDFLRALEAAVTNGVAEGKSLDEMLQSLSFPDYEDWLRYEDRRVTLITETYELLAGQ